MWVIKAGDAQPTLVDDSTLPYWRGLGYEEWEPGLAGQIADPASAVGVALRAAFVPAAPALSDFVYDGVTGNLTSYKEDGVSIVLTYNIDGTVATMKRGSGPAQTFTYASGNLTGVA